MEILRPVKHKVWGWQAVINFYAGGMASGLYLLSLLSGIVQVGSDDLSEPLAVRMLPPVLAGLGFFAVAFEAGRPLRAAYLLRNLRISWMSREIAAGSLFIVFGTLDVLFPSPVFASIAGAAALGLIVSQGFIVFCSVAVRSWNMPLIPVLFLTSGLWSGFGLMLVARSLASQTLGGAVFAIGLALVSLDFLAWIVYLYQSRPEGFGKDSGPVFLHLLYTPAAAIGHLVPMAIIVILMANTTNISGAFIPVGLLIAGLATAAGALLQKAEIILGGSYLRAIRAGRPLMRRP